MRKIRIVGILCALFSASHAAATQYSLAGSVEQNNPLGGEQTYDLYLTLSKWLTSSNLNENKVLEVIAPNGMRFQEVPGGLDWVQMIVTGNSLADFNANFVGDWIFEESLGSIKKQYSFTLPAIPSAVFGKEPPFITSPADGAIVGKVFDVKWDNPDGMGIGYRTSFSPPLLDHPAVTMVGPGHAVFSFLDHPDMPRTEFTDFSISVDAATTRFQLAKISPNADATLTALNFLNWEIRSQTISFTIIPEPASILLLGLAMACGFGGRGFVYRPPSRERL